MGPTEYGLLALVIVVPLAIAVVVTLWSLEQVRYRPKRRRPATGPPRAEPEPPDEPGRAATGRPGVDDGPSRLMSDGASDP